MIKLKLNEMLEKRGLTAYALHVKSDRRLHQSVIAKIRNNNSKSLQLNTLNLLCELLGCQPSDIIVYESGNTTQAVSATQTANTLTFSDVLKELKLIGKPKSESALRRYLKQGKLRGRIIKGEWVIEQSDVGNFINSDFFRGLK